MVLWLSKFGEVNQFWSCFFGGNVWGQTTYLIFEFFCPFFLHVFIAIFTPSKFNIAPHKWWKTTFILKWSLFRSKLLILKLPGCKSPWSFLKITCFQSIVCWGSYGWWTKSCTSWYGKYPIVYRVLYIPGGAGFRPSTVCVTTGGASIPSIKKSSFRCVWSIRSSCRCRILCLRASQLPWKKGQMLRVVRGLYYL